LSSVQHQSPRRERFLVSQDGVTSLRWQNPKMIAWWSASFPGFGHFLLHHFYRGYLLSAWEVIINSLARINEAIFYSLSGQYELAASVVEPRWAFAYAIVYLFSIWDSYIKALDANKQFHLAKLEGARIQSHIIKPLNITSISFKRPISALVCSFIFPGLGQLYNNRISLGFYGVFWWFVYMTMSRSHEALLYLILGKVQKATALLNPHWLLFMPSVICGAMYDAYMTAIDHNRLFRVEQKQYFEEQYPHFSLHQLFKKEDDPYDDH
jgi:TM2 domain-containing membrane protein YozV